MDSSKASPNLPGASREPRGALVSRERRAQPRHDVDARANLLLVRGGLALPGKILNLSLIGCRIRCDERFKVGIYTRVETEFYLGGMSFRLAGVIQAIHSTYDLGIRFLDVSQRKREQIQQLIREIEETGSTPQASVELSAEAET